MKLRIAFLMLSRLAVVCTTFAGTEATSVRGFRGWAEMSVLLSWPGENDGWTVESATDLNGPWTPSNATPFMQGGRHSIAAPTDGERGFFRLVKD